MFFSFSSHVWEYGISNAHRLESLQSSICTTFHVFARLLVPLLSSVNFQNTWAYYWLFLPFLLTLVSCLANCVCLHGVSGKMFVIFTFYCKICTLGYMLFNSIGKLVGVLLYENMRNNWGSFTVCMAFSFLTFSMQEGFVWC